ncbi:MAG: hypothetical protein WA094_02835 [Candidatus Desulfobacillus denitrificans]|nr:hypothetical protein [Candidatus Hydrogenedentota bacterium]
MNMQEPNLHPALRRFAQGPTVQERAAAITDLLADKVFQKVAKTEDFASGVAGLMDVLRHSSTGDDRLAALVQLVRISQSAKTIAADIRRQVAPLLNDGLVPVRSLKEADDRAYVAKACRWTSAPWVLDYAIDGMVSEDTGETVRAEFAEIVFSRATNLTDIFLGVRTAATGLRFETESPADSMAGRLARIIAALRVAVVGSLLPPGDSPGERLAELIRLPMSSTGLPTKEERQLGLAKEIILCTYDLVRTRFSLATDSDTYSALKAAKRLFVGGSWPEELRHDLERMANSILEAILLLAKQGLSAQSLAEHLEIVVNHRQRADALLRDLADGHPELSESVRAWLRKATRPKGSGMRDTVVASQDLRTDPFIAQAILDASRVEEGISALQAHVIPALQLYDPTLVSSLESHVDRAKSLVSIISDIGRQRRLGVLGIVGQEMDFAPKYFEAVGGSAGLRARVLRPAVVRLSEDGQPGEVVVKGLVESGDIKPTAKHQ